MGSRIVLGRVGIAGLLGVAIWEFVLRCFVGVWVSIWALGFCVLASVHLPMQCILETLFEVPHVPCRLFASHTSPQGRKCQ